MTIKVSFPGWLGQFGRLAIANTLSNLMVPLAGLIDTAFLGHLSDIRHLAGVALASLIFNVIYWSFGFLRMGTTGLVAQAVGRNHQRDIWLIGLRGGLLALGLGLILVVFQGPLRTLGFTLLQADATILAAGQSFYDGRIWGAPAVLVNYVLLGWFLGQGQGRRVVLLSLVANGSNIVLDYGFIYRLGWASYGAGLATALSQGITLAIGLILVVRAMPWGRLGQPARAANSLWQWLGPQLMHGPSLQALFRLNRDILIRTFALVMSFSLFTHFSAGMGTTILALNTLLLQVVTLAAYGLDGIAFATETYAGQFYGQGDRHQLQQLVGVGICLSMTVAISVAMVFIGFPIPLFSLLTDHATVLGPLPGYVVWLLPVLTFGAIAFLLDGYFLGLTAGHTLRNSTIIATCLGFLPLALMARWLHNPHLLWLAMTCFMATRAGTLGFQLWRSLQKIYER